jgi:hypothetical protein
MISRILLVLVALVMLPVGAFCMLHPILDAAKLFPPKHSDNFFFELWLIGVPLLGYGTKFLLKGLGVSP